MSFSLLFRKYPLFRTLIYSIVIAISLIVISIVTVKSKKIPEIASLNPPVGSAGDTITITGENFGNFRETSYVEIGGSRITASGYIEWSDNSIKIIIPSNVQDGLVSVVTGAGKSKPSFFANETGIPIEAPPDTKTSIPVIASVNPTSSYVGNVITISGSNFGSIRGNSSVYFTANKEDFASGNSELMNIPADDQSFDYEYWTDSEIRVRIPDGAKSGTIYVKTEKGISGTKKIEVKTIGTKKYSSGKTYVIELDEDVDSIDSSNATNITLRVPRPIVSSSQPIVLLNECVPEPIIADFKNTVIHQIELQKSNINQSRKLRFTQNFVVTTYEVHTDINPKSVKYYNKDRVLYKTSTASDNLIKCDDSEIIEFAKGIVGKENNPYLQAKMIYEYMVENITLLNEPKKSDSQLKDLLEEKIGDAYDFAILYTTLLRSLKIPALPVAGVLLHAGETENGASAKNHWWTEFYIENFGWIPVDVALGTGLAFVSFKEIPNNDTKSYYFGNLDNQHIAFSRGWNEIKQSLVNGKIVYKPRSFAFQSIWEESSEGSVNYSSLWNDPIVLGIY